MYWRPAPQPRARHGARHWAEGKSSFSALLELWSGFRNQQPPALPDPSCSLPSSGIVSLQGTRPHSVQLKSQSIHWSVWVRLTRMKCRKPSWASCDQRPSDCSWFLGSLRSLWFLLFTLRKPMPSSPPTSSPEGAAPSLPSAFPAGGGIF